jgi:hypothetical protein
MERDIRVTIGFVVAAVILLAAQFLITRALPAEATIEEALENIPQQQGTFVVIETHRGLQDWQGSIMDSDMTMVSHQGRGDMILPIKCESGGAVAGLGTVAATIQKMEEDGTLIVAIVQDGQVLKQASTSAAYGVVSIVGEC